jgi:hypothetical protein
MGHDQRPGRASADNALLTQISEAIAALQRILPQEPSSPTTPKRLSQRGAPATNVRDLTAAFTEIVRMQETLTNEHSGVSGEFAAALSNYRHLLKQFKAELPRIHGWLLAERERLRSKRSHSEAVENWVRTTRQTRW